MNHPTKCLFGTYVSGAPRFFGLELIATSCSSPAPPPSSSSHHFKAQRLINMQTAARFHGNQDVRIERVELPPLAKGEVRVKQVFLTFRGCSTRS